jgi:hypothetical protein
LKKGDISKDNAENAEHPPKSLVTMQQPLSIQVPPLKISDNRTFTTAMRLKFKDCFADEDVLDVEMIVRCSSKWQSIEKIYRFFDRSKINQGCWFNTTMNDPYRVVMAWKHPGMTTNQATGLFFYGWEKSTQTISVLHDPLRCESAYPVGVHGFCCRPSHLKYGTQGQNAYHTKMAAVVRDVRRDEQDGVLRMFSAESCGLPNIIESDAKDAFGDDNDYLIQVQLAR